MAALPNIPDPLRERLLRQGKRVKFVRVSFAVTSAAALLMMFGITLVQGLTPTLRATGIVLLGATNPEEPDAVLIDETIDSVGAELDGSFRLALMKQGKLAVGSPVRGVAGSFALLSPSRALVVFETHFLEFDLSGDPSAEGWPKVVRRESLGINETEASPAVAVEGGTAWLCWLRGTEVRLRKLDDSQMESALVHTATRRGAVLDLTASEGRLWLTVLEKTSGQLKLLSFVPHGDVHPAAPGIPESEKPASPRAFARIDGLKISDVRNEVRISSMAVLQGKPVIVLAMREKERGADHWEIWHQEGETNWVEDAKPDFPISVVLPTLGFMSLSGQGDALAAVFADANGVRLSLGRFEQGKLAWNASRALEIGPSRGFGPLLVWLLVLLGLMLLLAGQGVWLLLNRTQEIERSLAGLLERAAGAEAKPKPKAKIETLAHASQLARVLALLVDLAATSPVVIMLKSVYGYEWTDAYGFVLFGTFGMQTGHLLAALQASLVTLSVLTLYCMISEMVWGKTFGKALLHMRVVDSEGEAPAGWQIVVRNMLRVFEMAHWALFLIPMSLMMLTARQQRLGDLVARTWVIVEVVPEDQADDLEI